MPEPPPTRQEPSIHQAQVHGGRLIVGVGATADAYSGNGNASIQSYPLLDVPESLQGTHSEPEEVAPQDMRAASFVTASVRQEDDAPADKAEHDSVDYGNGFSNDLECIEILNDVVASRYHVTVDKPAWTDDLLNMTPSLPQHWASALNLWSVDGGVDFRLRIREFFTSINPYCIAATWRLTAYFRVH